MVRFLLNVVLVAVAAYAMVSIGWLSAGVEGLPMFGDVPHREWVAFLLGAAVFAVVDTILEFFYATFLAVTFGVGCITAPVWLPLQGSVVLYLTSLTGFWVVTTPGPLLYISCGFLLSLLGNIASFLTARTRSES